MKSLFLLYVLVVVYHATVDARPIRLLAGENGTAACRKAHYVEDGRLRMCECDRDCNIENHFCAEGLTCSKDGVCRGKKDCNIIWLMHPPHALAVLGIIAVVVGVFLCVCWRSCPYLFKAQSAREGDHVAGRAVIDNTTNGYVTYGMDVNIPVAKLVGEVELENNI